MNDYLRFTLSYDGNDYILNDSPDGWNDELLNFERSEQYHGIFRTGSLNLRFVGDGALVIRKAYYTDGIEAEITLTIEYLNKYNLTYYTLLDSGEFDLNEFKDEKDFVEAPIIQGGLQRSFDTYHDTVFELTPTGTNVLRYDGVKLYSGAVIQSETTWDRSTQGVSFDYTALPLSLPESVDSNVDNTGGAYTPNDIPQFPIPQPEKAFLRANRRITASVDITATDWDMYGYLWKDDFNNVPAQDTWYLYVYLRVYNSSGVLQSSATIDTLSITFQSGDLSSNYYRRNIGGSLNYQGDITLETGEEARIEFKWEPVDSAQQASPSTCGVYLGSLVIETDVSSTLAVIEMPVFKAKELMETILSTFNSSATFESTFLDGLATNEQPLFVSGDVVRSISGAKVKISMEQVFNALNGIWMLGMGVEGDTLVLEERDYFYNPNVTISNLGEVKDMKLQPAKELIFRERAFGWKEQEYDELNGRDEFNAPQNWGMPLGKTETKEEEYPDVRADMYGIDFLRISYDGDSSTDTKNDNENFILDCEFVETDLGINYYKLSRDKFSGIIGVVSPDTAYNLFYSPKRCLIRWGAYLKSICTGTIELLSADKNVILTSLLSGEANPVQEMADINTSTFTTGLFSPHIVEFDVAQPPGAFNTLNNNPTGLIWFSWLGTQYSGYIMSASVRQARKGIISYTVLLKYGTDLTELIRK